MCKFSFRLLLSIIIVQYVYRRKTKNTYICNSYFIRIKKNTKNCIICNTMHNQYNTYNHDTASIIGIFNRLHVGKLGSQTVTRTYWIAYIL